MQLRVYRCQATESILSLLTVVSALRPICSNVDSVEMAISERAIAAKTERSMQIYIPIRKVFPAPIRIRPAIRTASKTRDDVLFIRVSNICNTIRRSAKRINMRVLRTVRVAARMAFHNSAAPSARFSAVLIVFTTATAAMPAYHKMILVVITHDFQMMTFAYRQ
ncbi:MAG: hypothetical protein R2794_09485 [Chitinophagales bacterium]